MPAKNTVKRFGSHQFYHVYNRGVAKQPIYRDQADKRYFLSLLDRHLNPDSVIVDSYKAPYKKFDKNLELLSYCLMGNHYHMLFYLGEDETALSKMMRGIGTAYTMYYNLKYNRIGPLFQGTYKASLVSSDEYLVHISRYIHLNPREHKTYKYSSLSAYLGGEIQLWLKPQKIMDIFEGEDYLKFLEDYEDHQQMLEEIKHNLANK
jgi:putative transposase